MLYSCYQKLYREGKINTGLSLRLPEYGNRFWLEQLERAVLCQSSNDAFLDIGAGCGHKSIVLLETYFKRGTAVEIQADDRLWQPLIRDYPTLTLIKGYLQQIPKTQRYDFILLSEVFEHIPLTDVSSFLNDLNGLVKKGGVVFLTTPNVVVYGPAEKSQMWHEKQEFGHHKHYSSDELKKLLEQRGFEVLWHCFECHQIKYFYNKCLYPVSWLDNVLLNSKRVPKTLRYLWKYLSFPFVFFPNFFFWIFAQIVISSEYRSQSNEHTGYTIFLAARKK